MCKRCDRMRVHILRASCEEGKVVLLLRLEVNLDHVYNERLTDSEREILEFIIQKGEVTQKEVGERFGKVKACRIIQTLEKKGLIERKKNGKTYVVKTV